MSASVVASQIAAGSWLGVGLSSSAMPAARAAPTLRARMPITLAPQARATLAVWSVQVSATTSIRTGMSAAWTARRSAIRHAGSNVSSLCAGTTTPAASIVAVRLKPGP